MKPQHTPTPWEVKNPLPARYPAYRIADRNGNIVANVPITANYKNDAEFIVRAVNSHDPLVLATKQMSRAWHDRCEHEGYFHNCKEALCVDNQKIIAQAEARP